MIGTIIGGGASASPLLFIGGRAVGMTRDVIASAPVADPTVDITDSTVARALVSSGVTVLTMHDVMSSTIAQAIVESGAVFVSVHVIDIIQSIAVRARVTADVVLVPDVAHAQLFVRGVRINTTPQVSSMNIKRALNASSECSFILFDPTQAVAIARGSDVMIYWRTHRLFAGIARDVKYTSPHATSAHFLNVRCVGYAGLLAKRIVNYEYDPEVAVKTLKQVVYDLWLTFFANRGEQIYFNEAGCPTVTIDEPVTIDFENMLDAMTRLCALTGTAFDVDETRTIQVYDVSSTTPNAPFVVEDDNGKFAALNYDTSDQDYANAVVLRTAVALSGEWTDTFYGDETLYQWFALSYTPLAGTTPRVFLNDVPQLLVDVIDPMSGYQFSWLPGFPSVFPRTNPVALVPFAVTDVIRIVYQVKGNNSYTVRDEAEIAARKLIEIGSGVHEIYLDMGDRINDAGAAQEYASAVLALKKLGTQATSYESSERMPGALLSEIVALHPGQVQVFDTTQPIVDVTALIDSVELRDVDGQFLAARVSASVGRVKEAWDAKLVRLLNKRAPKSNAQDLYGFAMAEDVPGKYNVGMIVTSGPVLTQFVDRACTLTSAVVTSTDPAQGSAVTIDILKNGVSILSAPIECGDGVDRVVVALNSIACVQYDKLAVNVLTVGSTAPGKNYRVKLAGLPTGSNQTTGFVNPIGGE